MNVQHLKTALAAALVVIAAWSGPAAAEGLTPQQRREVEQIFRDLLVKHPEILMEALEAADEKMKADAEARASEAVVERKRDLLEDPAAPIGGNPKGDVTVVEFFDYRCPYCKQVHPDVVKLLGEDRQVRFVYKEFPILGKDSTFASRAALAAVKQGKYEPFHNALMSLKGSLGEEVVMNTASSVGLDVEKLKTDMRAPEIDAALKRTYELAQALDIRGTPAFVIGGKLLPGAVDAATLRKTVAQARKG
jgi:protein-disulfide isomerase